MSVLNDVDFGKSEVRKVNSVPASASTQTLVDVGVEAGHGESSKAILMKTVIDVAKFRKGSVGGADLAWGQKIGTIDSGFIVPVACVFDLEIITGANASLTSGEVALGTTAASGANATVSGTEENIVTAVSLSAILADTTSSQTKKVREAVTFLANTGSNHNLFLNVAGAWGGTGDNVDISGTVTILWSHMASTNAGAF